MPLNIEFKAPVPSEEALKALEARLLTQGPRFAGEDHQVDTYFRVPQGRLKLREGNVEQALIHYHRGDAEGARASEVLLYEPAGPAGALKAALSAALGVMAVVDKRRRIYFLENVKFHFDRVDGLGTFIEVEAIDRDGSIGQERLEAQCAHYIRFFGVETFEPRSYSDLMMAGGRG